MNSIDIIRMAFGNLWRRKMRTILTVLGVIIGTTSIVVMLSLGLGMNYNMEKQISRMGSINTITVYSQYGGGYYGGYMEEKSSSRRKNDEEASVLNDENIATISNIHHVTSVLKTLETNLKVVSGKYMAYLQVVGVDPEVMDEFGFNVGSGRLLESTDTNAIFFGSQVPYNFYNPKSREMGMMYGYGGERPEPNVDVLNDSMIMTFDMTYGEKMQGYNDYAQTNKPKYKRYNVYGVGISPEGEYNDFSWQTYMNIEYVEKLIEDNEKIQAKLSGSSKKPSKEKQYNQLKVKVDEIKNVKLVQEQINAMGFNTNTLTDILDEMKKTSNIIQAVLGGIGAISLLVAALGITNTMVMSIYERTREIGVMKVLGCILGNIRRMFLLEAGLIGFIGGVIGIGFSFGISVLLNKLLAPSFMGGMGAPGQEAIISLIPYWLVFASLAFSTSVGIVSGLYPARRAMKISALEAINNS